MAKKIFNKRVIATLLTLVMLFNGFQISASAASNDTVNLVQNFEDTYYKQDGTAGTANEWEIHLSKTAAPTAQDNVFDITLKVETKDITIQTADTVNGAAVLVLDVSGSMDGYPLDTAKKLITTLVSDLNKNDSFNLILFCNGNTILSPKSLPATEKNISKAMKLINQQHGYGGTELDNAIQAALDMPADDNVARSIVILTDGYISGETETFDLICQNLDESSFFPFGIGSSVNRYLIEGIASAGQGEAFIVTDEADASETAQRFRTYMEAPLLTDIEITYDGLDVYHVEPVTPSTLYAQKPIILFGKWRGEAKGNVHITGKTGKKDFVLDIPVSEECIDKANTALPYLWARKRIERLTDFSTYKDNPSIREEVTRLGLTYSMATSYTSFVAVLETIVNPDANATDVDQPNALPLHVSNLAIGSGYTAGSEPGTLLMILGGIAVALKGTWKQKKKRRTALPY